MTLVHNLLAGCANVRHQVLVTLKLRFSNTSTERTYRQQETLNLCAVDRLAYFLLLSWWLAGLAFTCSWSAGQVCLSTWNLAVPASYLLLLLWSCLRQAEYARNRRTLTLSARLLHWPSATWLKALQRAQPLASLSRKLLLLKTALRTGGVASGLLFGVFLRDSLPYQALLQLLLVSRYMVETRAVCAAGYLQGPRVQAFMTLGSPVCGPSSKRTRRIISGTAAVPLSWRGVRPPALDDYCFAFLTTVELLGGWGLPMYVAYLQDRGARRRWVLQLPPGQRGAALSLQERVYWQSFDFLTTNLTAALVVLPLGLLVWHCALLAATLR